MKRALCTGLMFSLITVLAAGYIVDPKSTGWLHIMLWPFVLGVITEIVIKMENKERERATG